MRIFFVYTVRLTQCSLHHLLTVQSMKYIIQRLQPVDEFIYHIIALMLTKNFWPYVDITFT